MFQIVSAYAYEPVRQIAKGSLATPMPLGYDARFDWSCDRDVPEVEMLCEVNHNLSTMLKRIIPNPRTIGLLTDPIRPCREKPGPFQYAGGRDATEPTATDLPGDRRGPLLDCSI